MDAGTSDDVGALDLSAVAARYADAVAHLRGLCQPLPALGFDRPVLLSIHDTYFGRLLWLECSALESLLWAEEDPEVAIATHDLFFHFQRGDGLIPGVITDTPLPETGHATVVYGQLQQLVPLARTTWQLAQKTQDERFLERGYASARRFDDWMVANRQTRGTGAMEMFCEYDMGLDYSPRVHGNGVPRFCPGGDAAVPTHVNGWPVVAPDLSAVVYGNRRALAAMADALGRPQEARHWADVADDLRTAVFENCYCAEDEFFYDRDTSGRLRRIKEMQLMPVIAEGLLTQRHFDRIWSRYLDNPAHYGLRLPWPSIAASDPHFAPRGNAWTGATYLNWTLRAVQWMPRYLGQERLREYMRLWVREMTGWDHWASIVHPRTGRPFDEGDDFADPDVAAHDQFQGLNLSFMVYKHFVDELGVLTGGPAAAELPEPLSRAGRTGTGAS
jgi:hypothetical protein